MPGTEAIVIPIIIDPKAGVAGLQDLGKQADKTNQQIEKGTKVNNDFGISMRSIAGNALKLFGAMKLIDGATKILVESFIEALSGANRLVTAHERIAKAQEEAVASTKKEVVELQTLYAVASDTSVAYDKRQAAIDALIKKYPDLLKNLRLESIGTQEVADAIQSVINNLVRKAQLDSLIAQIAELSNDADSLRRALDKVGSGGTIKAILTKGLREANAQIKELTAEAVKLQAQTIQPKAIDLTKAGKSVGDIKIPEIKIKPDKVKVEVDKSKAQFGAFGINAFDFEAAATALVRIPAKFIQKKEFVDNGLPGVDTTLEDLKRANAELLAQQEALAAAVADIVAPAFADMFDAILNKENALQAFFKSIIRGIENLIAKLLEAVVQAAILSALTGGTAGGGLSFRGQLKKIFGFASGGLVTGPVSALVGEGPHTSRSNPEVVSPLSSLKNFFTDIIEGFNGTGRMGTAGVNLKLPAYVQVRQSGRDMVGTITLENESQGRTG